MIGARDIVWGIMLGVLGTLALQSYPLWKAERMVVEDANDAFLQTFAGRRMLNGRPIQPRDQVGLQMNPLAAPINFIACGVSATHVSWNGRRVEMVLHHVVGYEIGAANVNPTHDVLVKLMKRGGRFQYEQFQARGLPALPTPIEGNPWLSVLEDAARHEPNVAGFKGHGVIAPPPLPN